jgi:indole-3-glycerol phosphate synthase/phosphoribosylanthranilate isomerase
MANVLEKIVQDKAAEIEQRKIDFPLSSFINKLTPSDRSFYQALRAPNAGYIFECKKASPSKGLIRENFDLDEISQAYAPYAACISVLTDEKYFQGKFEYLSYVRQRVTQPVINKDFFIDPYQVHLARHYNADAILLMLSVLDDAQYNALAELADHYQLDVLTEVSNESEVERALALKANIIGINNRDLRDLSTDLATTERLVPLIKAGEHECVIISESGIYTNQDVRRLAPLVDGFLVGSSVMAEQDIAQAVKKLVFGTVKICGITNQDNAQCVSDCGAIYAGLIFHPKSMRFISLDGAKSLVSAVPLNYVGVFVDASLQMVAKTAATLGLHAVQLHGTEDQNYISSLRAVLPRSCQIWKAIGVETTIPAMDFENVDKFLLDCKVGEQSGGTGQVFDWRLLDQIENKTQVILAGGLNPSNIVAAANTKVFGLDINSGIEQEPGIKDPEKIKHAFEQLRAY